MSELAIHITGHAEKRLRGRLGWTPTTMHRMAERVLAEGIRIDETAGKLNRFLVRGQILHRTGNNTVIYGHELFVFQDRTLVTTYTLPRQFHACVDKIRAQRVQP